MVHEFEIQEVIPISRIRSITSQLIACLPSCIMLLDLGMGITIVTIALPNLLKAEKGLSLSETQASWFGSLAYITQILGALLSAPVVDYFGRKRGTFIVNIPFVIAWILMYYAWSVPVLFVANGLIGLGGGLVEAPIHSYVGEISEASLRGAFCTFAQLFACAGMMLMSAMGIVLPWRRAALAALAVPFTSMILTILIPETPIWLLSRKKEKEALKSLCYLRGWSRPDAVRKEFEQLMLYTKTLQTCAICVNNSNDKNISDCVHGEMNVLKRTVLNLKYNLSSKATLRPLTLLIMYLMFVATNGSVPVRPNMVNVCKAFGMAADGKKVVAIVNLITFLTTVLVIVTVKYVGKRIISVTSLFGGALCCLALSAYAKLYLDDSVFSYDVKTFPQGNSLMPLVIFFALSMFSALALPWTLSGEVFPFRSRAICQGLAAAGYYVMTFLSSKTLINLEQNFHLWGTFMLYAAMSFTGSVYLYFFLPETEGKSLQEIESFFDGKFKTFANLRLQIFSKDYVVNEDNS